MDLIMWVNVIYVNTDLNRENRGSILPLYN